MMDDNRLKDVENMEKEVKFQVIHVDDEHDGEAKRKLLDEFTQEVTEMFAEFKEWLKENSDPEKVASYNEKIKAETALLIQKVKLAMIELQKNENIQAGKKSLVSVSKKWGEKLSDGVQEVIANENVQKVMNDVGEKVHQVKEDERVKRTVKNVKRGTLHVASSAFEGLKKILEEPEENQTDQDLLSQDDNKIGE